jgi:NAD(P)-dependent dehydrogenase (short-subunit alcohol dehydrogenase family)
VDRSRGEAPHALVTGGADFVGSHLCKRLLGEGCDAVCLDDLCTGSAANVEHLLHKPGFEFVEADVTEPLEVSGGVEEVYDLASPASPADVGRLAIQILRTGSVGTQMRWTGRSRVARVFCSPPLARFTATHSYIPSARIIGVTWTRSGRVASTTRPSVTPRL